MPKIPHFQPVTCPSRLTMFPGRSPCPMLNALANHGFLPHNGQNISMDDLVKAFSDSVNLEPSVTKFVSKKGFTKTSTGRPDTLNLDDLDQHDGAYIHPFMSLTRHRVSRKLTVGSSQSSSTTLPSAARTAPSGIASTSTPRSGPTLPHT